MGEKLKNSDNHRHLWNAFYLTKNDTLFLIFVQLYLLDQLVFPASLCFALFEVTFLFKCFNLSSKSVFSTKSLILSLVAKFAYFNLATKFSAVVLLNSCYS